MVSARMDGHAGNAARASNQLLGQRLLSQIVHPDVVLGGHKQEGLQRVEQHPNHPPPVLPEGVLASVLGQLMHQDRLCVACGHTCQPTVSMSSNGASDKEPMQHEVALQDWPCLVSANSACPALLAATTASHSLLAVHGQNRQEASIKD